MSNLFPGAGAEPESITHADTQATPAANVSANAGGRTAGSTPATGATPDCPEAIAQWATFGERDEGNWFTRLHDSDKAFAERNGGQRECE